MSGPRRGWIGVDLDGTLAEYHGWKGLMSIGEPVPAMVERVKGWLKEGLEVRIFTARVHGCTAKELTAFQEELAHWCNYKAKLPYGLKATNIKDFDMIELWDDRAVTVEPNTGLCLAPTRARQGLE